MAPEHGLVQPARSSLAALRSVSWCGHCSTALRCPDEELERGGPGFTALPRPRHPQRLKRLIMEKHDPRDPKNWIPRDLFAAYLGPHSDDMLAYYDKAVSKKNQLWMSFSPLAVFLLPAWLGLRQQWTMWATFTGLIGVLPFIEHALGIAIPSGAFVGTGVAMGMMARGLLLTSANGHYLKLTRQGLSGAALLEALR